MKRLIAALFSLIVFCVHAATWHADNGNGTFTNPLFYDEFSDPDLIRVGDDYYLTGTTMHSMPGLPVLHSRDLVNWKLLSYASEGLNFGPEFRLEEGKSVYGRGIWAPSFRHYQGVFYIFSNVNGRTTQLFTATNPAGPWSHRELKESFHDLSVLFDDDGRVYVVWGYNAVKFAELDRDFSIIPGTQKTLVERDAGMGEGSHLYKIGKKYYITSAWWSGRMRMPCARADRPEGPYEINPEISADEEFGIPEGARLVNDRGASFELKSHNPLAVGRMALHQGGLVQTQSGEWWGFSMMDYNSVGRLTCLSPVTWSEGWPYFGLPGNPGRTPRTWTKPDTGNESAPSVPYQRNDDFRGPALANVWQWNHFPVAGQWSLEERPGFLRLRALPASDLWNARGTLTQRAVGPESSPTATLETNGMKVGDIAGLALFNHPYGWIAVAKTGSGIELRQFDQRTEKIATAPLSGTRVWLRAHCDFLSELASFSYSLDGENFRKLGDDFMMIYQGKTFQGVRYSLFSYHDGAGEGGHADFDDFTLFEPHHSGFTRPIPAGQTVLLENLLDKSFLAAQGGFLISIPKSGPANCRFKVVDVGRGRVAFETDGGARITVAGGSRDARVTLAAGRADGDSAQTFQWMEMPYGQIMFLSLSTNRYLRIQPDGGAVTADAAGADFDHRNGASFTFRQAR